MDDNNYLEALQDEKITNVDIEREVKKSFIEYAMSVIIARALPDEEGMYGYMDEVRVERL